MIAVQDVALSPRAHRDAPVLGPKVQLQGQGLQVVPGVEPGTSSAPTLPRPREPQEGGRGQQGAGWPLEEGGVIGLSHVALHHEAQERGLAPLQVVHAGPVGDVSVPAENGAADTPASTATTPRPEPRQIPAQAQGPAPPAPRLRCPGLLRLHQVQEVLQHALHRPWHLGQEQTLHHPVGVPGGRTAQDPPPRLGRPAGPSPPTPAALGRSPVIELDKASSWHDERVTRVDERGPLGVAEDLWLHLESRERVRGAQGQVEGRREEAAGEALAAVGSGSGAALACGLGQGQGRGERGLLVSPAGLWSPSKSTKVCRSHHRPA